MCLKELELLVVRTDTHTTYKLHDGENVVMSEEEWAVGRKLEGLE